MKPIRPLHIFVIVMTAIAMSLVLSVPSEAAEKRLALVIGNDGYKLKPLNGPVNDAIDMEKALRKLGFEVIISTEAGQSEMLRAIGQFGEKLRKADVGLFYYSGHGVQNKGENYLIPTDTEKEILQSEVNLRFKAVPAAIVTDTMNEAGNRLNIVILDACRSNPYSKSFKSMRKGLAKMDGTSGMFIAYAAEADKEAEAASSNSRNSIYTAHLLKHISVPGLPMERMFKEVRKGVLKDTGNEQRPCEYGSITDDFYFNGEGGREPPPAPVYTPPVSQKPKPDTEKTFTNSLGMKFVKIPAGSFTMGSPSSEPGHESDETQHSVTISKPFYMQTTEVTQGQWKAVMGSNPSKFSDCGNECPVEMVSWDDVQEFIKSLNRKGDGTYRLPTEAEWEYAARAGTTTPFSFGNCLSTDQANYDGNNPLSGCPKGEYRQKTVPVGSFSPNAWGLYDMHGNVWEWCADWKGDYPSGSVTDPTGPSSGSGRVVRGGSWYYYAQYCRSANRYGNSPGNRGINIGFRLVRP